MSEPSRQLVGLTSSVWKGKARPVAARWLTCEEGKMAEVIDDVYLPFTEEQLREHFVHEPSAATEDQAQTDPHTKPYVESAEAYHAFCRQHPDRRGLPLQATRLPCQIEKDERFWTAAALMSLYHHGDRRRNFAELLGRAFRALPSLPGLSSWEECLQGELRLYFEVKLPSPVGYKTWLSEHLRERHFIPYVLDAAETGRYRNLEGPTVVDAVLVSMTTGFAVLFEAKVLSDISCGIAFDVCRNQIARNVDVMLEPGSRPEALADRDPERTLFCLLTPELFRAQPDRRLYGWLFAAYRGDAGALGRDLAHREGVDWEGVAQRLGWATWEDCEAILPGACRWLSVGRPDV
jgi:hypothetical protein